MRIIYPDGNGGISVFIPSPDSQLTVEEMAKVAVPSGQPYLIIQDSDLPTDRTYRKAWTADFSAPDGHGGTP